MRQGHLWSERRPAQGPCSTVITAPRRARDELQRGFHWLSGLSSCKRFLVCAPPGAGVRPGAGWAIVMRGGATPRLPLPSYSPPPRQGLRPWTPRANSLNRLRRILLIALIRVVRHPADDLMAVSSTIAASWMILVLSEGVVITCGKRTLAAHIPECSRDARHPCPAAGSWVKY